MGGYRWSILTKVECSVIYYLHRRFSRSSTTSTIATTKLTRIHEIKSWSPVKTSVPWSLYVQFYVFYKLCVCMCWRKQETFRHGYSGHMPMDWTPTAWFANTQESWIGRKWTVCSGGSAENNPSNIANNHFNQVGFMTIIIDFDHHVFLFSIKLISHACDGWPKKGNKFHLTVELRVSVNFCCLVWKNNKENCCFYFVSCKFFAFRGALNWNFYDSGAGKSRENRLDSADEVGSNL